MNIAPSVNDQVTELHEALSAKPAKVLGLSKIDSRLITTLMQRTYITRDTAYAVCYFDKAVDERPAVHVIDVYMSKLRKWAEENGLEIRGSSDKGWFLNNADKLKLKRMIETWVPLTRAPKKAPTTTDTIESNVPIPEPRRKGRWPFTNMKVGDSIYRRVGNIAALKAIRDWKVRHPDLQWKFTTRKMEGGVRVWRIV
jgi:hypothetical protein